MKLKNRVALVTGASPNIGGGIIEALAEAGAKIIAVDNNTANAQDCANYLNNTGGQAIGVTCDVADEVQVQRAVQAGIDAFGQIDILVNNAGYFNRKGALQMSYAEWLQQSGVLLGGTFLFTKYVAERMIARGKGGNIINIISTAGHQGEPNNVCYSTCKGGLLNMTRSTAMELSVHDIRVNSLTPTATDPTESYERAERWGRAAGTPPAGVYEFAKRVPLQRLPKPSDYGKAAVFLASDDASMITGIDLRVDAGAVAKYWAWDPAAGVT